MLLRGLHYFCSTLFYIFVCLLQYRRLSAKPSGQEKRLAYEFLAMNNKAELDHLNSSEALGRVKLHYETN